ncbi:cGMP-inhibited 3',5'-cyclic phosphodiesterase A-like [Anneissia japonica]|uniref:cGMP-inhibited 3',5'-cyclic phosphodiesterase A-like n=1 Tax=Anneissia japonica TaxID=1529436 RepID=UPI00142598D6|nr:cGMP-inhibited 3',5'-cyclic phosphodiesterase A-like [Anneissia japonica]
MATGKSGSVRYGGVQKSHNCDDRDATDNNGYMKSTVSPIEYSYYNPYLPWLGLKPNNFTQTQSAALFATSVACISCGVYFFQNSVMNFFHLMCGLFAPMFSIVCAFYWLSFYFRKAWTSTSVYLLFLGCNIGEIVGQLLFGTDADDSVLSTWLVATVLVFACLASTTSSLKNTSSVFVLFFLSIMRFLSISTLGSLPQWFRPFIAYLCGILGCILAKYMETRMRQNISVQFAHDEKIPVICRRRTSSQSSTASIHSQRTRRTSLPALIPKSQVSNSVVDVAVMQEAHGLIMDMLADTTLPANVIGGLRAVGTLISPPTSYSTLQRPKISPLVALTQSSYTTDMDDSPYVGDKPVTLPKRLRRSLPPSLIRRMSTTWTTTTSATGMPTLEPQPLRTRSSSFRQSRDVSPTRSPTSIQPSTALAQSATINTSVGKLRSYSLGTSPGHLQISRSEKTHPSSSLKSSEAQEDECDLVEENTSPVTSTNTVHKESDGSTTDEKSEPHWQSDASQSQSLKDETNNNKKEAVEDEDVFLSPIKPECRELINNVDEWDYPIFELAEKANGEVLSQLAYKLFHNAGIFETFRIPIKNFMLYFRALENGYRDNGYHNRVHAADVLHAVYYLSSQQIPGFTQVNLDEDRDGSEDSNNDLDEVNIAAHHTPTVTPRASFTTDVSYGILALNLPALELMALYTAAAMHDYDHPGRTNAFLVATSAPEAILYNDRSVLESHHAAASWKLLLSNSNYNFLSSLDPAEFKRFRYLVVEYILATDLKRHFDFLVEFNAKVNDIDAPGINWASENDRMLACQMCIKLADICGPTKTKELHTNWTDRITEEFYDQGDDERKMGLPVSPYMDRHNAQLAKLQEGFINHLVAPLCNSYGSAGLLPGVWVDESSDSEDDDDKTTKSSDDAFRMPKVKEEEEDEDEIEEEDTSSDGATRDANFRVRGGNKTRKMTSILTKHLKENHEMWLKVLKEEEEQQKRKEKQELREKEEYNKMASIQEEKSGGDESTDNKESCKEKETAPSTGDCEKT